MEKNKQPKRRKSLEKALERVKDLDIVPLLNAVADLAKEYERLCLEYEREEPDYASTIQPTYAKINKMRVVDLEKIVEFRKPKG